ncbi:MAG TPA: tetratricopeptide repeat protein [Methylomirabilota bacterium]|jgi:hypothetical protein|nr:tetratricopeptide repeat protein [Methylomirabilota bacterium]
MDRLLTRGQEALGRRDFAGAEALLCQALARDPGSAHTHLYLGHALAEQERRPEAEAALGRAMSLGPENFVFPLHLGIVRADAGDPAGARAALDTAARLAPDNPLVAGYLALVAWDVDGGRDTLAALGRRAHDLPESFRARLLLRLAALALARRGGKAALALLEPPPDPPFGIRLPGPLRIRWRRRRLARARRLLAAGRAEDAATYLAAQPDVLEEAEAPALLAEARRAAVSALHTELEQAKAEDRPGLLLRRYEMENDLGDHAAAGRSLEAWLAAYAEADPSASERVIMAAASRRLAEFGVERGDWERALQRCAESRAGRPARETDGVEAVALLALGRRRAARHRFEDFLADALFPIEVSVTRVLDSTA